jgi:ABC-2 type transport system ATP-binding protein
VRVDARAVSEPILSVETLSKTYPGGFKALDEVSLEIQRGEIFGLLGPNGAGKTTLIGAICGLVRPSSGTIRAFGRDLARDWRHVRQRIGLVPQELGFDMFDTVERQVAYSRGLFGAAPDRARIEEVLRSLSLWDKRGEQIRKLSGGMKRRVLIAKALAHDPEILFLDEPTAGVDVELRRDMWRQIDSLREKGVTIILTTHYLEEAQEMADRIGVIDKGRVLLVDGKDAMMRRLGRTEARFSLAAPLAELPPFLSKYAAALSDDRMTIVYRGGDGTGLGKHEVADIARLLTQHDVVFTAIEQRESTLEDIFVDLVAQGTPA